MAEYLLPDVGEGLTEAEIVAWKVKVGDVIAINDIVVEIETAKSLVELPSPYAGTVLALLVEEGETIPVGTPIISVGDPSAPVEPVESTAGPAETPAPAESAMEIDLSNPPRERRRRGREPGRPQQGRARRGPARPPGRLRRAPTSRCRAPSSPAPSPDVEGVDEPAVPATSARTDGVGAVALAKPPVRKLAKDLGVDLTAVAATGPGGTVTRADVESAASLASSGAERRGARPGRRREGRPRAARAGQGRAQDDGGGDGAVRVLRPARDRVGDHRRDPHDGVRRPAQEAPRVPRRQGLPASRPGARGDAGDPADPRDQLLVGRGRPGGRLQVLRQPGHRGGHAPRAGGPQRQGRRVDVAARARGRPQRRSPRPPARAGPSRPR